MGTSCQEQVDVCITSHLTPHPPPPHHPCAGGRRKMLSSSRGRQRHTCHCCRPQLCGTPAQPSPEPPTTAHSKKAPPHNENPPPLGPSSQDHLKQLCSNLKGGRRLTIDSTLKAKKGKISVSERQLHPSAA